MPSKLFFVLLPILTEIVKHLSEHKSQVSNVDMITPPGSPRPSTSSKSYRPKNERNPKGKTGNGKDINRWEAENEKEVTNKLVAIEGPFINTTVSPRAAREVLIVTSEEEYIESSDDDTYANPRNDDQANGSQMADEQKIENEADETIQNTNDSDDQVLILTSPTADGWGKDVV